LSHFTKVPSGSCRKAGWEWSKIGAFGDMLTKESRAILGLGCYGKSGAHLFPEKRQHFGKGKQKTAGARRAPTVFLDIIL
jgi:hypothetical protein